MPKIGNVVKSNKTVGLEGEKTIPGKVRMETVRLAVVKVLDIKAAKRLGSREAARSLLTPPRAEVASGMSAILMARSIACARRASSAINMSETLRTGAASDGNYLGDLDVYIKQKERSLGKRYAFLDVKRIITSVDSDVISEISVSLRHLRNSKSAKSTLSVGPDRFSVVRFWKEGQVGWEYNCQFSGRASLGYPGSTLFDAYIKSMEKLIGQQTGEEELERVWSRLLLSGPKGVI